MSDFFSLIDFWFEVFVCLFVLDRVFLALAFGVLVLVLSFLN